MRRALCRNEIQNFHMVKIEITQPVGVPAEQAAHKGHVVAAFHNGITFHMPGWILPLS